MPQLPETTKQKLNYISALLEDLREVPSTWVTLSQQEVTDFKQRIYYAEIFARDIYGTLDS